MLIALVDQLSAPISGISNRLRTLSRDLTVIGAGMEMGGRRLLGPLEGAARASMELESAMADVRKVVDFPAPDGLAQLTDELERLSLTIPLAAAQLAEIAAAGGQLGVGAADLEGYTETVAKMATAFDMLPGAAGESAAKLANVFGIPVQEIGLLGDAINHLSNNTAAKASEITESLLRAGGTGRQFGLLAPQVGALTGALIALGKSPEVAATGVNALLLKLQTASKQGLKFQSALSEIGLEAGALEQAIGRDAQGALLGFLETLQAVEPQARAGILADLFGLEYSDDISLLVGSLDQYRRSLGLVADEAAYAGSMQAEFAARSDTAANRLALMRNRADVLSRQIGSALVPALMQLMDRVTPYVERLGGWIDRNKELAGTLAIVAGAVGGILVILGPAVIVLANVLGGLSVALGVAAKAFGVLRLALIANPIGALIAVIAGAVWVFTHWEETIAAATDAWEWLAEQLGQDPVAWVMERLREFVSWLGSLAGQIMDAGAAIGRSIVDGIKSGLSAAWESVKALAARLADSLPQWVKDRLGIKSPSRVFRAIGIDSIRGLEQGLAERAKRPLAQMRDIAGGLALGASVVATPLAAAPMAAGGGVSMPISIHIHAPAGADAQQLAELVRREVAGATRQAAGRIAALYDGSDGL